MSKRASVALGLAVACSSVMLIAQTPTGPAFEVASIKENTSGPMALQRVSIGFGDRVTITNMTAQTLIKVAYSGSAAILVGAPGWTASDRFDIVATTAGQTTQEQHELMLRTLLAERFKLVVHTEKREEPTYALVVAARDGKWGPGLRRATASCASLRAESTARGVPMGPNNMPCGNSGGMPPGTMNRRGFDMEVLAGNLRSEVGRRVVNKTGLTGDFDWELKWTPPVFAERPFDRDRFPTIDPDGPPIFTALQEQLGLKLEAQDGEGEVLVIDRMERPTPN